MKKYEFRSKASLETFIKDIDTDKYKILEGNIVELAFDDEVSERDSRMEEMRHEMRFLFSEMQYMYGELERHYEGHLPPIKGAGRMEEALKALGIDKDYEVKKATLFANRLGEVEVDLSLLSKDNNEG
jgi:hypothetical protein